VPKVRFSKKSSDSAGSEAAPRRFDLAPMTIAGGTFLGTLRVDEDEDELREPFASLMVRFNEIIASHIEGTMSDEAAGRALGDLVCQDRSGASWTIGATSRQWYRRQRDGSWVATPVEYGVNAGAGLGR
jgi:hypothetical protein